MEGILLPKRIWQFLVHIQVLSFWLMGHSAQASDEAEINKYERALEMALYQLDRAENGREPCFTSACQQEKSELLEEISRKISRLPIGTSIFEESSIRALTSAWKLIDEPFSYPRLLPKTGFGLKDLKHWWERRYSHDLELPSSWTGLVGQLLMIEKALQFFIRLSVAPESIRDQFEEAWNAGLGEYTSLERELGVLFYRIRSLEVSQPESLLLNRLEYQRSSLSDEKDLVEADLPKPAQQLLLQLFPKYQANEAAFILQMLSHWLDLFPSDDLFDRDRLLILTRLDSKIEDLKALVREFQELEYGLVGLNNFNTMVNPVVATNYELKIQENLDLAEGAISGILDLGAWTALYSFSASLGMQKALYTSGIVGATSYYALQYDLSYSELFFEPQNRRADLLSTLPVFEDRMAQRQATLKYVQKVLLEKIQTYRTKLSELEGNND